MQGLWWSLNVVDEGNGGGEGGDNGVAGWERWARLDGWIYSSGLHLPNPVTGLVAELTRQYAAPDPSARSDWSVAHEHTERRVFRWRLHSACRQPSTDVNRRRTANDLAAYARPVACTANSVACFVPSENRAHTR